MSATKTGDCPNVQFCTSFQMRFWIGASRWPRRQWNQANAIALELRGLSQP
jgi:hypothetical protein